LKIFSNNSWGAGVERVNALLDKGLAVNRLQNIEARLFVKDIDTNHS